MKVRQINFIQPNEFPYETHNEAVVYDSGDFPQALDECLRLLDYDAVKAQQAKNLADKNAPLIGVGFSCWLEIAGF